MQSGISGTTKQMSATRTVSTVSMGPSLNGRSVTSTGSMVRKWKARKVESEI
jgi:hypothetical protein